MKKGGLRERWLVNTVGVILALGMVCVMLVTAVLAGHYYRNMQADVYHRTEYALSSLSQYRSREISEFRQACCDYVRNFENDTGLQLQFVDLSGVPAASSAGETGNVCTPELAAALTLGETDHFLGKDPASGKRIFAVSCPVIHSSSELIGVLRGVVFTAAVERQVWTVLGVCVCVMLLILLAVYVSSHYFLRSVIVPLRQITEKAGRIASGSYGTRIDTKYDDEIGVLAETISELSAKISQNEKLQAEFISQLSHELRTPLTVINGWSETLLADETLDTDTRQGLKVISGEARRLTDMVMELLDFTKMQDGRMTLAVEMSDIRAAFEDTIYMYGSSCAQEGIRLHYEENDEEIPEIPCDPQRLRQVFLNILDNASKHGGNGDRIDAAIGCDDEHVTVTIRDYGPGIAEDELPLVKKKFYKGSSSIRGTGIGLAVCDEIVALHGGTLTLENAPGGGTVVTVALPIHQ